MRKRTYIELRETIEGLHRWEAAPNFLRHWHHHRFVVRVKLETITGDPARTMEFFALKRQIREVFETVFPRYSDEGLRMMGDISCEAMIEHIHAELDKLYPNRAMEISIHEDDYSGAITRYEGNADES